ncbi:glycosyl hydrolase [Variovorax sp. J22R115]|uniref:glycosyl hydrolase n=1 Tax=Variovorax sp. J22R115 TaxID=3053509 RepID=UPI0025764004|nr:glycosyl hydrolase [Variovorax sp. J22R115]MDM0049854.1 glycosyl hydrolase [Variovorax sp. J22R115]
MKTPRNFDSLRRRQLLGLGLSSAAAVGALGACGGGGGNAGGPSADASGAPPPGGVRPGREDSNPGAGAPVPDPMPGGPVPAAKSTKRGVAYDVADAADLAALSPGVSWWYGWGLRPSSKVPADFRSRYGMDFHPMLWNGDFDAAEVESFLLSQADIRHLLLLNEPNLTDQANLTPSQAAQVWPRFEALAKRTGVKLVGPAITWGTMPGFADPVVWLDAFFGAYRASNNNRDPNIDYLAFHWYDYGLAAQLDRLAKYGKSFWITEFANWHGQADGAQIDSVAKQKAQMSEMVAICESRADVFRYAWFTGRWSTDLHHTSLLGAPGELTDLGKHYISLPFKT